MFINCRQLKNQNKQPVFARIAAILTALLLLAAVPNQTRAQQPANQVGFNLGFYFVDANTPRSCASANSTLTIEGNTVASVNGAFRHKNFQIAVTFQNSQVTSITDTSGLLQTGTSVSYGPFHYILSHLAGKLKATLTPASGGSVSLFDVDLDKVLSLPDIPSPNQSPSAPLTLSDPAEYIDFAIPCTIARN